MNDTPRQPALKPVHSLLVLLFALVGFAAALGAAAVMPLHTEGGIALAYAAAAAIAAVSITVVFRLFVNRPKP